MKTIFTLAAAPLTDLDRLPHVVLWIWLHLLQFDVSNQTINPEEDTLNKSDRPVASGRISLEHALFLRWILVPICLAFSACYTLGTVYASASIFLFTILYNELGASAGHWIFRHFTVGIGFASFEIGATLVGLGICSTSSVPSACNNPIF